MGTDISIIFISNFMNHHQYPLGCELNRLTKDHYAFIETMPIPQWLLDSGYPIFSEPWIIRSWENSELNAKAKDLIFNADVVIWDGHNFYDLIKNRLQKYRLTFEYGERWLKRGLINLMSPRLIKNQIYYHLFFRNKPLYHLNASAYAANDYSFLKSYKDKMFKWGYFPKTEEINPLSIIKKRRNSGNIKLLWVSRMLKWKHPELPVQLMKRLKDQGYNVSLDMFGTGPLLEQIRRNISELNLEDIVNLRSNVPNQEILEAMKSHHLFIFTSNKHEGWGAVINEAMSNVCPVVCSNLIGSVPFLITNGVNGLIFDKSNLDSLEKNVRYAIDNYSLVEKMAINAYDTIKNEWSPYKAATNLIKLCNTLLNGNQDYPIDGTCSPAYPLN